MESFRSIKNPVEGILIERPNRFVGMVEINGKIEKTFIPDPGRLEELVHPGAKVMLEKRRNEGKTLYDCLLIETKSFPDKKTMWISIDSRLANKVFGWALETGIIDYFGKPSKIKREPVVEHGRLDFLIEDKNEKHYIELKSVNLLDSNGIARFPDAPTKRGTRHLETLINFKKQGYRTSLVFFVNRTDPLAFSPFGERDPVFASTLLKAKEAGVEILALKFASGTEITYHGNLDIILPAIPFPEYWPKKFKGQK